MSDPDPAFDVTAAKASASFQSPSVPRMSQPTLTTAGFQYIEEPQFFTSGGSPTTDAASMGSKLRMVAVRAGESVTRGVTTSLVAQKILQFRGVASSTVGTAPAKMAAAQLGSGLRGVLAVVRIPLSSGTRMRGFVDCVGKYAVTHTSSVAEVSRLSAGMAAVFAIEANIVGALVAGAVQESMEVGRFMSGSTSATALRQNSVQIAVSIGGSLVGGATGAAIGSLVFPGAGTAFGSLMGSYMGCYMATWMVPRKEQEEDDTDVPLDSKSILPPPSAERGLLKLEKADDWILVTQVARKPTIHAMSHENEDDDTEQLRMHIASPVATEEAAVNELLDSVGPDELMVVYECVPLDEDTLQEEEERPDAFDADPSVSKFNLRSREWRVLPDSSEKQ